MARVYITASYVHTLLHTKTLRSLRPLVRRAMGLESDFSGSAATRHGNRHEATAIKLYERRTGTLVRSDQRTYYHPEHEWLGATPDFVRSRTILGEVKCPYSDTSEISRYIKKYLHQIQTQLYVTGRRYCDFVVYRGGELDIMRVPADTDWAGRNMPTLIERRDQIRDIVQILYDDGHERHAEYTRLYVDRR